MKQKFIKISMIILFIILFGSLTIGIINFTKFNQIVEEGNLFKNNKDPEYHFMVIVDGSNPSFSQDFIKGINKGSIEYNVAYEFWEISGPNRTDEILKQVDIAINSDVDGIIVYSYNNLKFRDAIDKATKYNIPVITINDDVPESGRISHVGVNEFFIGLEIGKLLNEEIIGSGKIIVLQRGLDENEYNNIEKDDGLIVLGIRDTIKDYGDIKVEEVNYYGESVLNAEEVIMNILDQNDDVKAIVCTNGQETLGVVQVLIDFNKISNIAVVGYDGLPEILDYIETDKKVVHATVIADYEKVGYDSIEILTDYKKEKIVANYSDVYIEIITKENISEYKDELSENNEKD